MSAPRELVFRKNSEGSIGLVTHDALRKALEHMNASALVVPVYRSHDDTQVGRVQEARMEEDGLHLTIMMRREHTRLLLAPHAFWPRFSVAGHHTREEGERRKTIITDLRFGDIAIGPTTSHVPRIDLHAPLIDRPPVPPDERDLPDHGVEGAMAKLVAMRKGGQGQ